MNHLFTGFRHVQHSSLALQPQHRATAFNYSPAAVFDHWQSGRQVGFNLLDLGYTLLGADVARTNLAASVVRLFPPAATGWPVSAAVQAPAAASAEPVTTDSIGTFM